MLTSRLGPRRISADDETSMTRAARRAGPSCCGRRGSWPGAALRASTISSQAFWEYANYAAAALGLGILWLLRGRAEPTRRLRYEAVLNAARA